MLAMNIESAYELHQAGRYADAAPGYQAPNIFKVDRGTIVTFDGLTIANVVGLAGHPCGSYP